MPIKRDHNISNNFGCVALYDYASNDVDIVAMIFNFNNATSSGMAVNETI